MLVITPCMYIAEPILTDYFSSFANYCQFHEQYLEDLQLYYNLILHILHLRMFVAVQQLNEKYEVNTAIHLNCIYELHRVLDGTIIKQSSK